MRVAGRVERFRDELQLELRAIAAAPTGTADPAAFLPVAFRDLDELDGFLEHLAGEVRDRALRGAARRPRSATAALRAALRRTPCTRAGHHAYLGGLLEHTVAVATLARRDLHPAPAPRTTTCCSRRRSSTTSGKHARVRARGRDRPDRRGPAARPRRARPAHARRARRARLDEPAVSPSPTACSPTTATVGRRRPRRSRCSASTRSTPPSRARSSTACQPASTKRRRCWGHRRLGGGPRARGVGHHGQKPRMEPAATRRMLASPRPARRSAMHGDGACDRAATCGRPGGYRSAVAIRRGRGQRVLDRAQQGRARERLLHEGEVARRARRCARATSSVWPDM